MTERARPFFGEREVDPTRPRLLLLSYHFPPGEATGALRWQKMARFAAERGWAIDAVTVHPSSLASTDEGRLRELPNGTRVFGVREPSLLVDRVEDRLWRMMRGVRERRVTAAPGAAVATSRSFARTIGKGSGATAGPRPESLAPDEIRWWPGDGRGLRRSWAAWRLVARDAAWARAARRAAEAVFDERLHRAVVSCGPPHMVHVAASAVAQAGRVPHVMDLRDPWSARCRLPEAYASPLWFQLARRHEAPTVARAALVVANTDAVRDAMRASVSAATPRFVTVTNGYDEEPIPSGATGRRFVIAYAGGIYLDRDPRPLLRGAARVVRELRLEPDDFGIEMIGAAGGYCGTSLAEMAEEEGLQGFVQTGPRRPRHEAIAFLAGARMLVSLPQDSPFAIPSKVFEYMQFDAWMLVLADPGSPVERLLRGSAADVAAPNDVDAIALVIRRRYEEHARGERPRRLAQDERFSRRYQAGLLFDALDGIVGPGESRGDDDRRRRVDPARVRAPSTLAP